MAYCWVAAQMAFFSAFVVGSVSVVMRFFGSVKDA